MPIQRPTSTIRGHRCLIIPIRCPVPTRGVGGYDLDIPEVARAAQRDAEAVLDTLLSRLPAVTIDRIKQGFDERMGLMDRCQRGLIVRVRQMSEAGAPIHEITVTFADGTIEKVPVPRSDLGVGKLKQRGKGSRGKNENQRKEQGL